MPRRKTTEEFVVDVIKKHPTISVIGEYINDKTPILLSCNVCGTEWEDLPHNVLHSSLGCPECNQKYVHVGENDFATKAPHLVNFFKNPSDASKITYMSHKLVELICPICGSERTMNVFDLYREGFNCQCCGDGVSYPNRLIRNVMKTFSVDHIDFEYHDTWTNGRFYDVYFELGNERYVVEMDGLQHYDTSKSNVWLSYEDIAKIDREKDKLALENDVCMIRIDCKISRLSYIKKNILNSKLSQIFDFALVDWNDCEKKSQRSIVLDVCEYYNQNKPCMMSEIAKYFGMNTATIRRYLLKGNELGLCSFKINDTSRKAVQANCLYSNEFYEFKSISECSDFLSKLIGCKYFGSEIGRVCKTGEIYKGFIFKFI